MNNMKNFKGRSVYLSLLLLTTTVFFYRPVFAPDFGYLNDYTAFMPLSFGFPESAGVLYLGRPIQALLANIQFRFLGDMLSLQLMRIFIVLMIATAAILFFRFLENNVNIKKQVAALLSLLIFTLPSMAINSIHIAQSVPGLVPVFFVLLAHHLIKDIDSSEHNRVLIVSVVFLILFFSLLTYPPVTFFFLTLTFIKFIFGTKESSRAKFIDIFTEVLLLLAACVVYFLFIKYAYKPFFNGGVVEESTAYDFSLSVDILSKITQAKELFVFILSASFPPLQNYFLVTLGIAYVFVITWATVCTPYLKQLRKHTRVSLGFTLAIITPIILSAPIFVIQGDYPILYRVTFASMAATLPVAIAFAIDRSIDLANRRIFATIGMLAVLSLFIIFEIIASHQRLVLQVERLVMEYQHVFKTLVCESFNDNKRIGGKRIFRVPPFASPPDPLNYLYRDFGYTSVDSSPEAMVRAVIQSIDAKNRYRSGNNNMDGFHVIYDPLGPRYESNFNEGIIFNRDGYPSFVSGYKGISGNESWGRWTDSQEAVIEFISPLPRKFTLKIKAGASSAVVNNSVNIIIGNAQFNTKFVSQEPTEAELNVTTDGKAKSITIKFPMLKSPQELGLGADTRHLGLALIRLQISADLSSK